MGQFHAKLHQTLKNLMQRSGETRHMLLSWLGGCLQANAGRTKIWANQMPEIFVQMYASDAFFLNLGAALLKLCQPFCRPRSPKLLTFNPSSEFFFRNLSRLFQEPTKVTLQQYQSSSEVS
jgi:ubiquitin conjugation factor E4 A